MKFNFRRHCYDKPHRCPGWVGGGFSTPKPGKDICPGASLADLIDYESRWRWCKSYQCTRCGTRTIPYITRFIDPTWLWWKVRYALTRIKDEFYWRFK